MVLKLTYLCFYELKTLSCEYFMSYMNFVSKCNAVDLHLVDDWLNEALNPFKRPYESEWNLMDNLLPLETMGSGDVIQYLGEE